jgi:hypothetical protein
MEYNRHEAFMENIRDSNNSVKLDSAFADPVYQSALIIGNSDIELNKHTLIRG